ncbi:peptidase S8/S53 domain-containing protein [Jimgerdemannia flammicorona]|uniref:Peptidase S8/S53 domain-containing protein n=1 Tax=Jimgerdemannia flammicorona TaxID=994334 RepID=A0A433D2R2_9FUNG|nr:peptidase S8/S53 domain-containing protein [Jimgerdemannia flammicorona]
MRLIVGSLVAFAIVSIAEAFNVVANTVEIPGQYIVKLNNKTPYRSYLAKLENSQAHYNAVILATATNSSSFTNSTSIITVINHFNLGSFLGFVVKARDKNSLKKMLTGHTEVASISPDVSFQFTFSKAKTINTTKKKNTKRGKSSRDVTTINTITQKAAQWNLARISQKLLNLNNPQYTYYCNAGHITYHHHSALELTYTSSTIGSTSFTQILAGERHWDITPLHIQMRVVVTVSSPIVFRALLKPTLTSIFPKSALLSFTGTMVAGVAAGSALGVAKKANIISVQIINSAGLGSLSGMISGLMWVVQRARKGSSVINMSLAIPRITGIQYLNDAITATVQAGVPIFASAGDTNAGSPKVDACSMVPSGNNKVFSVASTDKTDRPDPSSNVGPCVSMFAPGVNIISDWFNSYWSQAMLSGTSMAAPHAAGVAALFMSQRSFSSPAELYTAMKQRATPGVLKGVSSNTPNLLLYNQL